MTLEEWKIEQEDDDFMFRLGNLSKHRTGLPTVVWIEVGMGSEHVSPRMLFNNSTDSILCPADGPDALIPVSLDRHNPQVLLTDTTLNLSPAELDMIKSWIMVNYHTLMAHWNGEIDSVEAMSRLQKL